ncbi:MAG: TolC family protein [Acidobacteria bacterium]|nr:MAG: TolC family protein [Acidobacteriota bacterium]
MRSNVKLSSSAIFLFLFTLFPKSSVVYGQTVPENLRTAWDIATQVDHKIAAARKETLAARSELGAAKGTRLPTVVAMGSYLALDNDITANVHISPGFLGLPSSIVLAQPLTTSNFGLTNVSVRVPIYTGGRIRHGIAAATSVLNATRDDQDRAELDVKLDVASAYINVLRAQHALAVAQSSVVSLSAFAADVQNVHKQGLVPRNDMLAAQVALADARQREIQMNNTLDIARASYNRLLGRPLTAPVQIEEITSTAVMDDAETLTRLALQKRPEMAALAEQAKAYHEKAKSTRGETLPQLAFSGGNSFFQNDFLSHQSIWSAAIGMRWDIFDGGVKRHQADALEKQTEAIREQRAEAASLISLQVRKSWLDAQEAQKRISVTQETVAQAEENLRVSKDRYLEAIGTHTEVLDAETLRVKSLMNHWNAIYDEALATMQLHRAIGDL